MRISSIHTGEHAFNVSVPSFSFFNEKGMCVGRINQNFVNL